jgi:hypothetical protein
MAITRETQGCTTAVPSLRFPFHLFSLISLRLSLARCIIVIQWCGGCGAATVAVLMATHPQALTVHHMGAWEGSWWSLCLFTWAERFFTAINSHRLCFCIMHIGLYSLFVVLASTSMAALHPSPSLLSANVVHQVKKNENGRPTLLFFFKSWFSTLA